MAVAIALCAPALSAGGARAGDETNQVQHPYDLNLRELLAEVDQYATSGLDPAQARVRSGNQIRVLYIGFRDEEQAEIVRRFPDIPGFELKHRKYGRRDENPDKFSILDYQRVTNTISIVNADLDKPVVPDWDKNLPEGTKPADLLVYGTDFMHNMARAVFEQIKFTDAIVELGPAMEAFEKWDHTYRNPLLAQHCTAGVTHARVDGRPQIDLLTIYSAAEPASDENLQCIIKQVGLFLRPASVSFDEMTPLKK